MKRPKSKKEKDNCKNMVDEMKERQKERTMKNNQNAIKQTSKKEILKKKGRKKER